GENPTLVKERESPTDASIVKTPKELVNADRWVRKLSTTTSPIRFAVPFCMTIPETFCICCAVTAPAVNKSNKKMLRTPICMCILFIGYRYQSTPLSAFQIVAGAHFHDPPDICFRHNTSSLLFKSNNSLTTVLLKKFKYYVPIYKDRRRN